ncbi:MAG TPA: Gfo/Idh/MocA family oxidoreductase [Chthoniobacterales bacterium]
MTKVKLGVVGLGWPGEQHAKAILASQAGHLYGAADVTEARRAKFAEQFSPQKTFASLEDMLADPAVDAVVVCLPNTLHFPATLTALEAGKHVLCEKPPTMNAAEMKVLREEAERRGLIYFFGRQSRFSPEMLTAKRLINEGRLGEVYFAKAIWVRSRGTPVGIDGWFTDKARSGGGALIDIGVHALDAVWYLMGTPKPVSVSAQAFRNFEHIVKVPKFDVDDAAYGFIRFENGAVVHLEVSWAANLTDDIPEEVKNGRELRNSVLYGPKATVQLNPLTLFEDQEGKLINVPIEPEGTMNPFDAQMGNFLAAIRGEAKAINDAQQAVYLMEMLDAIYLSSEKGREIPIA